MIGNIKLHNLHWNVTGLTFKAVREYLETLYEDSFEKYDEDGKVDGYVAAFVRGDRDLNMIKLVNALNIPEHAIAFADESGVV